MGVHVKPAPPLTDEEKRKAKVEKEKQRKLDYMKMLSTRKPTKMNRLVDSIPLPAYSVPKGGLPMWSTIPLDRQIPFTRIPNEIIYYAKNKLGNKLYAQPPGSEFDCWPGTVPEYDPLHDPNLRVFLRSCRALVLPAEPPCSLPVYNEHRRRLHYIRAKQIKMEIIHRDEVSRDALLFQKVEEEKEKRRVRFARAEKARENMRRVMEEQEEERKAKERELYERQKNMELRIIRVQEMKEERKQEAARRGRARKEIIRQRVEASKEIAMMKKVKTLKMMRLDDIKMIKSLQQAKDDRIRKREEEDLRRWNDLWRSQQESLRQRSEMLRVYTETLNTTVAADLKEHAHTQAQRDRILGVIQRANMKRPRADKERDYARELRHKMANNWRDKQMQPALRKEKKPYPQRELLREAAQSAVSGRSPSIATLDRAGQLLEQWEHVPIPVRSAVNAMMARAVLSDTKKQTAQMLLTVYSRALGIMKNFLMAAARAAKEGALDVGRGRKKQTKQNDLHQSTSQRDLEEDIREERESTSLLEKALVKTRRIMTQVVSEHVHRGLNPETVTISTLPRVGREPTKVTEDDGRLAMLICHTRASDITITTDLVKAAAEKITLMALRVLQKDRDKGK